jgi:hypothetical protein
MEPGKCEAETCVADGHFSPGDVVNSLQCQSCDKWFISVVLGLVGDTIQVLNSPVPTANQRDVKKSEQGRPSSFNMFNKFLKFIIKHVSGNISIK